MTQRAKWLGVGGLVVVWLALLYVYVIDVPPPHEVPLTFKSGQIAVSTKQNTPVETWDVKSLSAQVRELPTTPKKNIFMAASLPLSQDAHAKRIALRNKQQALAVAAAAVSATLPIPSAPPPPSPEDLARQQEERAAQAARQQEELHRKQTQEQMAQYRYLGYVNQNGVKKAFLGKGREIYILRQGDMLDGTFLVAAIEAATVRIRAADSNLETTIKLKKEESSISGT